MKLYISTAILVICSLLLISCTKTIRFQVNSLPTGYTFPQKDTLSILTWNVEHFVDEHDNPYISNNREDKPREVEKRIGLLAEILKKINADVVVLEEFESRALAMRIAKDKLNSLGYRFFGGTESPDWYMNVVIMSKLPIGVVYSYGSIYTPIVDTKDSLGRLETQSNINTRIISSEILVNQKFSFILTGVHLKAGRAVRDSAMRIGQIQLLHAQSKRFLAEDKNTNLVIAGDFNATPESGEFQFLIKGDKKATFIDPLAGTNVFSHPSEKPRWRIDHIIINKNMQKYLLPDGVKVAEGLDIKTLQQISDHLPIVARFAIK
ncbi:MAG: endonuclease/exonuclease/phosphatase family protein [Thermoflexibacter sp.]